MRQSRRATKEISQRERANLFGRDPAISRGQKIQSAMEYLNLLGKGSSKLQSAMEYLMTYGWAILIIAVVLGVLYYLGIFNGQNLSPRLQPGSCHVARTSAGVENFGVCAGLPEFVAEFNGQSSLINSSLRVDPTNSPYTFTAWVDVLNQNLNPSYGSAGLVWSNYTAGGIVGMSVAPLGSGFTVGPWAGGTSPNIGQYPLNSWHFVVVVYPNADSTTRNVYVDGKFAGTSNTGTAPPPATVVIGGLRYYTIVPSINLANIQIYNTSLSQDEITALYMEGIGGAPIKPQNIVGWWPLNGDPNDYSGNNNNGQSTAVQYTNTWINSYSAP